MMETPRPHPKNSPGPFYVVDGCCMTCDTPFVGAPGLFAYDNQPHCYVQRQPGTKEELDRMLRVVLSAEAACIRYRGKNPGIRRRLAELALAEQCDVAPPAGIQPVYRDYVTFQGVDPATRALTATQVADALWEYLRSDAPRWNLERLTPIVETPSSAEFSIAWFKDQCYPLAVHALAPPECGWLMRNSWVEIRGNRKISFMLHDWFQVEARFSDIRWYSEHEWNVSKQWREIPW